jgi:hypothetical protein
MRLRGGAPVRRWEIWIVWLLGALALASVPIVQGQSSVIWDALNHHIYLGWIAEHPRFDRDFMAAGWQSFQYPYVYWPAYKLAAAGLSGVPAGVALAFLQSLAVPPLWLVSRSLCPGERIEDIALRVLGVALALAGAVTLSLLDTTSNDLLAGIPLIWAVALGLQANEGGDPARSLRLAVLSGVFAGISVAFKLSNGPLALVLPLLWAIGPGGLRAAAIRVLLAGTVTVLAFIVAYAPWGWQMWQQFGNPFYPLYTHWFEPLQALLGWHRP